MAEKQRLTLRDTTQEVFVAQLRRTLPQRDHTSLDTDSLQLCTIELVRTSCELVVVHVGRNSHLARVDLKNTGTGCFVREREFNLSI